MPTHTQPDLRLDAIAFADPASARRCLERLQADARTAGLLARHSGDLAYALSHSASPDRAILALERLLTGADGAQAIIETLTRGAQTLRSLLAIMGASQLLAELLIRDPALTLRLDDLAALSRPKEAEELAAALQALLDETPPDQQLDVLRDWQQHELFRIGSCDLLGLLDQATVTAQLSRLADVLIAAALTVAAQRTAGAPENLCVLALGKLGGGELNYSSDIDLLFLAAGDVAQAIPLGEALIHALAARTARGFLYRVDMRLRPWGRTGPLVMTAEGYRDYMRHSARLWERQALLKARPVAGNLALGLRVLEELSPLIYDVQPEQVRADVRESKQRIEDDLLRRGRQWGEVKRGIGSLRDIEFVAQMLQLTHGGAHPEIRTPNTLDALARLANAGLLSSEDDRVLAEGYRFLRPVEHYLQLMHGRQTHKLPADRAELAYLGRRLGFGGDDPGDELIAHYEQHAAAIRAVYERHVLGQVADAGASSTERAAEVARHVQRMAPSYAETFSPQEVARHADLAERLGPDNLVEVDALPLGSDTWRVTIVGYDYPGELSVICGLLTAYGCDIREGDVFSYEPAAGDAAGGPRKIVDVFSVHRSASQPGDWEDYGRDLARLLSGLASGERRAVRSDLARLVAGAVREANVAPSLAPIVVELDNDSSPRYTVLYISAPDTLGFLYEFTNALAVLGYDVGRMTVDSSGARAHDTLYLTDRYGRKVTDPERQRELRAATVLVKHFTHLLPHAPDPGRAITHFQGFVAQLLSRADWPSELASLTRPRVLGALARLLGVSDFLWTDLLRLQHENLFPIIRDVEALAEPKPVGQLRAELEAELQPLADDGARAEALNAFKDREIFRADMRHILGYLESFGAFSGELSDVAEVVVEGAYALCRSALEARHGAPRLLDGAPAPMAVLALGKLGGREIGYASDIELMFLYAGDGETAGPEAISVALFYEELVRRFLQVIRARREGIFEVDLRLRPYGEAGSLAVSLESFRRYFGPGGAAWPYERQALVRLRPIAGDEELARQALSLRDAFVYDAAPADMTAIQAMRERQLRHLVAGGALNAKFSRGGLVDIEYLVQALQMRYGRQHPAVRSPNTQQAMAALAEVGALAPADYDRLREAHILIRHVIDALRMVRGNARDLTVPLQDPDELAFLARRCGYGSDTARFRRELQAHMAHVQELVSRQRL